MVAMQPIPAPGVRLLAVSALVAIASVASAADPTLSIVIPGMGDQPTSAWVGDATALGRTRERYLVVYDTKRPIDRKRLLGQYLKVTPLYKPGHIVRVDPDDPKSMARLKQIAAKPSVTVTVDMDLAKIVGPVVGRKAWSPQTQWAGKVAATLAEAHRQKHPKARVSLFGYSAGTEGVTTALKIEQDRGRRLFDLPIVASMRNADALRESKRKDVVVITADGDYIPSPQGVPKLGRKARRELAAKTLAKDGYRVVEIKDDNPWIGVSSYLPAHLGAKGKGHPHHRVRNFFHPDRRIVVYPNDGGKPVEMPSTSLGKALETLTEPSATGKPRATLGAKELRKVAETLRKHEPTPGLGGISLNATAEMPIEPHEVSSASYDPQHKRLVLHLRDGKELPLPSLDPEILRLAYRVSYLSDEKPELSIGASHVVAPDGRRLVDLHPPGRQPVHYFARTRLTLLGLLMVQADQALGKLAFGSSATVRPVAERVPGFRSLPELFPQKYCEHPGSDRYLGSEARVFLHPALIELVLSSTGHALEFGETVFSVRFGITGPAEAAFAAFVQSHFDEIVSTALGAPLRRLVPAARAVAVFRWLRTSEVRLEAGALTRVPIAKVLTPEHVRPLRLPSLSEIAPRGPGMLFGPFGPTRIVRADGGQTTIRYRRGLPVQVRRHDGAVLEVLRDGLDWPVALRLDRADAAAFLSLPSLGPVFADNVSLHGEGQGLKASLRTDTVAYPNNRPEGTVALIAARFSLQESRP